VSVPSLSWQMIQLFTMQNKWQGNDEKIGRNFLFCDAISI
jgi:hypothetical protein